ncbi:MAG: oligosaccharide flippase family protein [Sphingomicrobium sp.]
MNRKGFLFGYSGSLFSSALITTFGLGVSSALNLAGLFLWVRLLSPAEFGLFSLVTGAALMLNALGFEWLRLAGARSLTDPSTPTGVSTERLSAWLHVAALLAIALAVAVLAATFTGLALPGLPPRWNLVMLLLAISEMPFAAVTLVARLQLRATTYATAMIGRSGLALGAGALLVHAGSGPGGIVAATALAQFAVTGVLVARDPLWRSALTSSPPLAEHTGLVRLGAPLVAGSALALAAATIDRYLVAATLGLDAAGRFSAPAELVAKTLGFALMALNLAAYPMLVRTYERDGPAAADRALDRNLVLLLAIGAPILLAFLLLPGPLAAALLGPSAGAESASLLPLLAVAALLRLLVNFHFAVALQLARRMALTLAPSLVTLALLIPLARVAITSGGLGGFVRLLVVAQGAGAVSAWLLARRALPRPARRRA